MIRTEQIQQAAVDVCGDIATWAFRLGAEWADKHPKKWDEEDEANLSVVMDIIYSDPQYPKDNLYKELYKWLESLPQNIKFDMTQEAHVSFETAKLLKEKGFDWDCRDYYEILDNGEYIERPNGINWVDNNDYAGCISMPTQQMALRWLREVYKIVIAISVPYYHPNKFCVTIQDVRCEPIKNYELKRFDSYDEACDAAIKYCFEKLK